MKEVLIETIGYDWWTDSGTTAKGVQKQLEGLEDGEDINIIINSPGGSVYEGIVIFNLIRDYAKSHNVSTKINCIAMSMGSYIALAARTVNKNAKVTASENSVVMIHNPWTVSIGDYRLLKKDAEYLEKLAALYSSVHTALSVKKENEIRAAMDEETYYVGKEIEDMGWANDFEIIAQKENDIGENAMASRDVLIANAQHELQRAIKLSHEAEAQNPNAYRHDFERAVALCNFNVIKPPVADNANKDGNILGGSMDKDKPLTIDDLKAQNKPVYDAVFALGETAGIDKERARVNAHLLLGEKSGSLTIAAKHIKAGVSISDETALAEYHAAKLDATHINARNADNVGDVTTSGKNTADDDAKLEAAFKEGYAGRDLGGNK